MSPLESMACRMVNALLVGICELLDPTTWSMYKDLTLDILSGSKTTSLSSQTLTHILNGKAGVILLHNDLALMMFEGNGADLPTLDLPAGISDKVMQDYFEACNKWRIEAIDKDENVVMGDDDSDDEAGVREAVLKCLTDLSKADRETADSMNGLLSSMVSLGLV